MTPNYRGTAGIYRKASADSNKGIGLITSKQGAHATEKKTINDADFADDFALMFNTIQDRATSDISLYIKKRVH